LHYMIHIAQNGSKTITDVRN